MLNVGVIGIGMMGQNHARVYSEIANLIGIADTNEESLRMASKRYNVEGYPDFRDLLELNDLDAVSVSLTTTKHFEVANAAIEAEKHVLIEKPMCGNLEQARKLVASAKAKGVVLAVGYIERHNPVVGFTKSLIEKKQFGEVISVSSRRVS